MAFDARQVVMSRTDAALTTAIIAMSAQFQACGLVKTADTGQLNPAAGGFTAVFPAAIGSVGYEIYRFGDALQATAPVFLRVDYGRYGQYGHVGVRLTIGTGSDGAGTITGVLNNSNITTSQGDFDIVAYGGSGTTDATVNFYCSGDGSRLIFGWFGFNTNPYFSIERTHAADGTDTNEGLLLVWRTASKNSTLGSSSNVTQVLLFGVAAANQPPMQGSVVQANGSYAGVMVPWPVGAGGGVPSNNYGYNSLQNQGDICVLPVFFWRGRLTNPSKNVAGYWAADIANDSVVNFTHYGAQRSFRAVGGWVSSFGNYGGVATQANHGMLMRWE